MRCGLDDLCGAASWCRASTLSSIATGSLGECFGGGKLASRFGIAQKGRRRWTGLIWIKFYPTQAG